MLLELSHVQNVKMMTNLLPKNNREVLEHLKANGAKENYVRRIAWEMSEDFDDHYDIMEPKQKDEEIIKNY
jgi:hypothetical protein